MMSLALFGRLLAAGEHATAVAQLQCRPDGRGDQPAAPADVEGFAGAAENDGEQVGVAQTPEVGDLLARLGRRRPRAR